MKILIADDETPIREWIQFSIEWGNNPEFEVVGAAENGNEAFEMALKYRADTVITDIKMPGMDGLMLMKKLQKELPYVSFIILTNHAEFSYAREAIEYGAKKYMLKSEMRGKDILEALTEIQENTQKLLERKEEDCYSSGYLDIYNCCYHEDNDEYVRDFWRRHHFEEEKIFQILAVKSEDLLLQKQVLTEFIKKHKNHILRPILRQEHIYLVAQAEKEEQIRRTEDKFAAMWKEHGWGISAASKSDRGALQILSRIDEADKLLGYSFFFATGHFAAAEAEKWDGLDRDGIKKQYRQIASDVLNEEKERLMFRLDQWFLSFSEQRFNCRELGWAREICMKMMMRMEEIFAEHFTGYQDERGIEKADQLKQCRQICRKLAENLYSRDHISYSQSVRAAIQYIHQYYDKPELSLKEVAKAIYRSTEYLSRLFKAETGANFSTYLMNYRLEKAKRLLLETDMKVYEIAYAVGYGNPSYFTKVYHEYTGMTPETTRSQKSERMS